MSTSILNMYRGVPPFILGSTSGSTEVSTPKDLLDKYIREKVQSMRQTPKFIEDLCLPPYETKREFDVNCYCPPCKKYKSFDPSVTDKYVIVEYLMPIFCETCKTPMVIIIRKDALTEYIKVKTTKGTQIETDIITGDYTILINKVFDVLQIYISRVIV
jgi:hypothetical protein